MSLADTRIIELTNGHQSEVMGIRDMTAVPSDSSSECPLAFCWQVEIYNWDEDATIVATTVAEAINEQPTVLDVDQKLGQRPRLNQRNNELALTIALKSPEIP